MNTHSAHTPEITLAASETMFEGMLLHELEELRGQGNRMGDNLRVFADDKLLSDNAIDVARFQSFIDVVRDESAPPEARQAAAWQLMEYLTDPASPNTLLQDTNYMFALWSDFPRIEGMANHYQQRLKTHKTERSLEVLKKLDGTLDITEDDWNSVRIGVDVPEIIELSQHVNVESILVRSALVLDRVATATVYDKELLKDILEIETVYAPLLDLLGLHASEAILRHHTEKARLLATRRDDVMEKYKEISDYTESVRESGLIDTVITDVVGINLLRDEEGFILESEKEGEQSKFGFIIDNKETPYGSKSYFSAIRYVSESGIAARFISRVKSPGSSTDKALHKYDGDLPLDIYAGTVVVDNIEDMVTVFKEVYGNIQKLIQSGAGELTTAPSKDFPVHLKGKQGYIDAVKYALGQEFEGQLDIPEPTDESVEEPFQVLKVTFNIWDGEKALPVEIQFQTVDDRNRSRLGGASHLGHKGKNGQELPSNVPGDSDDLLDVNYRKWAMQRGGEEIYYDKNKIVKERQIREVQKLQNLVMIASFEPERLAAA